MKGRESVSEDGRSIPSYPDFAKDASRNRLSSDYGVNDGQSNFACNFTRGRSCRT